MSLTDLDPDIIPDDTYDEGPPDLDPASEADALIGADRHLRHVARLRHELAVLDEVYQAEYDRLRTRHDARRQILNERIDWHLTPVRQLHQRLIEADPKRKTIELPHGALKMRTATKPKVFVDDQPALVAWALESAPELLPEPTRINVTDLRDIVDIVHTDGGYKVLVRTTGELVPAVHAEVPAPTWSVDTEPGSTF